MTDGGWIRRLVRNPVESGTYLVCRMNGVVERMNYGTSCGWDNKRENRDAKADMNRRVIAWRPYEPPPREWNDDWRQMTGNASSSAKGDEHGR